MGRKKKEEPKPTRERLVEVVEYSTGLELEDLASDDFCLSDWLDEVEALELSAAVEDEFGVYVPPAEMLKAGFKFGELLQLVMKAGLS